MRRLFLQNLKPDDSVRAYIFSGALENGGQRCDKVMAAIMGRPGQWRVDCAPGYVYLFAFDRHGRLIAATPLR